jgi:uncharacterized RDD family membrane protein YckC
MEEQHNPYGSPQAPLHAAVPPPYPGTIELASPWIRLAAALLDGILAMVIFLPVMLAGGYWTAVMQAAMQGQSVPLTTTLFWSLIGLALFVAVQGYPLHRWAQTWGKRVAGVQIVDMDGQQPSLVHLLVKRYLPVQVVALVPFVGNLLIIVDSLFVFRQDRRCVHDLIAGTQVIVNRPQ